MDAPESKNNSAAININYDYISNLPADIKEKIIAELSLKEAVRTSILSSTWKDSWTSLSDLVFDEASKRSGIIELVDQVLRVHRGPIRKFRLHSWLVCNEAISRWMLVLSTNQIEHLDLGFPGFIDHEYVIPSCFFSCNALKSLHLSFCSIINAPQFFNEFTLLHTLFLYRVNLLGFDIEKLVSSCPLLEHLELYSFVQQGSLRILAPKLTFLTISADFHDICLETPKLIEGNIYLPDINRIFNVVKDEKESRITRALGRLSNIQKLNTNGLFLEYLAMGPIPKSLPTMLNNLSEIYVELCNFPDEIPTVLCLFQSAPNLKEFHIKCMDFDPPHVEGSWESKAIRDCLFKRLEVVKIRCNQFHGDLDLVMTESMLEFAKLVLSTAPLLEEFRLTELGEEGIIVVYEELKLFPKLSEKCKIVLLKGFWCNHGGSVGDEESYGDEGSDSDEESYGDEGSDSDEKSDDSDEESFRGNHEDSLRQNRFLSMHVLLLFIFLFAIIIIFFWLKAGCYPWNVI